VELEGRGRAGERRAECVRLPEIATQITREQLAVSVCLARRGIAGGRPCTKLSFVEVAAGSEGGLGITAGRVGLVSLCAQLQGAAKRSAPCSPPSPGRRHHMLGLFGIDR
jgi:hypothetical protein